MITETPRKRKVGLVAFLGAVAVGAVALGVPWTTVLFVAIVLCCPLMMLFMGHGGHGRDSSSDERHTRPL
jgi:hypothetical protein